MDRNYTLSSQPEVLMLKKLHSYGYRPPNYRIAFKKFPSLIVFLLPFLIASLTSSLDREAAIAP